mgnify:FL=1|jgi:hypothetical protein|tara:strand:+ start:1220 stop:1549 length:330 start_codon:yes stop_codon:yes gene_type:complete
MTVQKMKIKTPMSILNPKQDRENKDNEIYGLIKSHLFEDLEVLKSLKPNPEFMIKESRRLRSKNTWLEIECVADYFNVDITDFKKTREKGTAIVTIKKKVKTIMEETIK